MKTLEDIIAELSLISEGRWTTGTFSNCENQCCALGHINRLLGGNHSEAHKAISLLQDLGVDTRSLASANDGTNDQFMQTTPKQRSIAFLKSAK